MTPIVYITEVTEYGKQYYQDKRVNVIYFLLDIIRNQEREFQYLLNATLVANGNVAIIHPQCKMLAICSPCGAQHLHWHWPSFFGHFRVKYNWILSNNSACWLGNRNANTTGNSDNNFLLNGMKSTTEPTSQVALMTLEMALCFETDFCSGDQIPKSVAVPLASCKWSIKLADIDACPCEP